MHNGIAYFDNAATTFPKPEAVYSFMDSFYRECGVNVGRGQHRLSSRANALMEETRKLILELFHCYNKRIIFTSTATEAINLVLNGMTIPENANVYISPFEHNAVTRKLHHLRKTSKFTVETLTVDNKNMRYDMSRIIDQFNAKSPYCIIISHASNVCGAIAPIEKIFTAAKKYNAITVADMCQTAALIDIDLNSEIFDYAVFEGHKTLYAPMGIGGVIVKPTITIPPLIYGGTGVESLNQDMPESIPMKYEAGSHNIAAVAGFNAALKWISSVGIENIYSKEKESTDRLITLLDGYSNITVIKPEEMIGVVSCVFDNYSSDNIGQVLSDYDIAVRTGLHCAPAAHKFLGTLPAGTVRFSLSYFNNDDDFNKLEKALDYIYENG